jgi:hypothetical protein
MKSTLTIKDLSANKELDRKAMSAVGDASGNASPTTAVNTPVATQTDVSVASLTNVLGNMNAQVYKL